MNNTELYDKKIADIVASDINTAHIFKKYGIDFCCGGGVTIEKACEKKNIDAKVIYQELYNMNSSVLPSQNYNNWSLDFLADYIVNTHHTYVLQSLDIINAYAAKVAKVHGEGHPPVIEIAKLFKAVTEELTNHMQKEEVILFPYIKQLVEINRNKSFFTAPHFGTVNNPIAMMEQEHENAGNLLKEIAILSNNYTPPDWACNTFKALYAKLDEFEQDLHIHVHLENNILFPKAIALENKLSENLN